MMQAILGIVVFFYKSEYHSLRRIFLQRTYDLVEQGIVNNVVRIHKEHIPTHYIFQAGVSRQAAAGVHLFMNHTDACVFPRQTVGNIPTIVRRRVVHQYQFKIGKCLLQQASNR